MSSPSLSLPTGYCLPINCSTSHESPNYQTPTKHIQSSLRRNWTNQHSSTRRTMEIIAFLADSQLVLTNGPSVGMWRTTIHRKFLTPSPPLLPASSKFCIPKYAKRPMPKMPFLWHQLGSATCASVLPSSRTKPQPNNIATEVVNRTVPCRMSPSKMFIPPRVVG